MANAVTFYYVNFSTVSLLKAGYIILNVAAPSDIISISSVFGALTLNIMSDFNTYSFVAILAPIFSYYSSLISDFRPASFSIITLNPALISLYAASNPIQTLFSPGKLSFGTPIVLVFISPSAANPIIGTDNPNIEGERSLLARNPNFNKRDELLSIFYF